MLITCKEEIVCGTAYVNKIQQLKAAKVFWPEDNFGDDLWEITVDGVHFWIEEPQHPTWSQDR